MEEGRGDRIVLHLTQHLQDLDSALNLMSKASLYKDAHKHVHDCQGSQQQEGHEQNAEDEALLDPFGPVSSLTSGSYSTSFVSQAS